jgi:hypothetical protein
MPTQAKLNPSTRYVSDLIIQLSFLVLFPGFFFYNTAIGIDLIPAYLGGYFAIVSLALFPALSFVYIKKNDRIVLIEIIFALFLIFFLSVAVINYLINGNDIIAKNHIPSVIYLANLFVIFKLIKFDNRVRFLIVASLVAMSLIIFYFSEGGAFYLKAQNIASEAESVATYQGFARSYLLTFLVAATFFKSKIARLLLYMMAIPSLYLNGARTELVAVVLLISMVEFYFSKHKLFLVILAASAATIIGLNADTLAELLPDNRILQLLDTSQASSAILRAEYFSNALRTIADNPLLGDYASYVRVTGIGTFAHNIFSAWVDLGLIGFLLLSSILIFPPLVLYRDWIMSRENTTEFLLALSVFSVTTLLVFVAKDYTYMLTGAAVGTFVKYKQSKYEKSRAPYVSAP